MTAHTFTSSDTRLAADRLVLTKSHSRGPRDSPPAEYSAEDSTASARTCQEPTVPHLLNGHGLLQAPHSLPSIFLLFRSRCLGLDETSRFLRHEHLAANDTPSGPKQHRSPRSTHSGFEAAPTKPSPTTSPYTPQGHTTPFCFPPLLEP